MVWPETPWCAANSKSGPTSRPAPRERIRVREAHRTGPSNRTRRSAMYSGTRYRACGPRHAPHLLDERFCFLEALDPGSSSRYGFTCTAADGRSVISSHTTGSAGEWPHTVAFRCSRSITVWPPGHRAPDAIDDAVEALEWVASGPMRSTVVPRPSGPKRVCLLQQASARVAS